MTDGTAEPGERDVPECWESLATDLFNLVLGNFEWVRAQGGRHSVCPLCHATCERDGGPGHQDDCPRLDYARRFDALRAALRESQGALITVIPIDRETLPKNPFDVLTNQPQLALREPHPQAFIERDVLARFVLRQRERWNEEYADDFGHSKLDDCLTDLEDIVRLSNATVDVSALRDPLEAQDGRQALMDLRHQARKQIYDVAAGRKLATMVLDILTDERIAAAGRSSLPDATIEPPEAQDGHRMVLSDQDGRWLFTDECGQRWRLTETGDESMPLLIEAVSKGRSSLPEGQK